MKKETITGLILNALLVLLFGAMLAFCALYVNLASNFSEGPLPVFPESEKILLLNESLVNTDEEHELLIPYFTGIMTSEGNYAVNYTSDEKKEIRRYFALVLKNAPEGTAKKVTFSDDEKKQEYLRKLYTETEECFYVRLKNGIEFSVLCQMLSDTYTVLPENPDFIITDMFLLKGSNSEANITAVDTSGNVLKIFPSKNIPFNNELYRSYTNTKTEDFEFLSINGTKSENAYFPVFKRSAEYYEIEKQKFSDCFNMENAEDELRIFVEIFGMNTDNTRYYGDSDGAAVFVENTTGLKITPDGSIIYTSGGDDGKLSSFLGFSDGSDYGFFDISEVAKKITESISASVGDNCAKFVLSDVVYNSEKNKGTCGFYFDCVTDGIPLDNGGEHVLYLEFSRDALVRAEGKMMICRYTGKTSYTDIPQKTAYVILDSESSERPSYFGPEYRFEATETDGNIAVVKWTYKTDLRDKEAME